LLVSSFEFLGFEFRVSSFDLLSFDLEGGLIVKGRGDRKNEPPTGEGKKQRPEPGAPNKLGKRSEVVQAQRGHANLNVGTDADEAAATPTPADDRPNPKRQKAGR
jgi:hypothetical protein